MCANPALVLVHDAPQRGHPLGEVRAEQPVRLVNDKEAKVLQREALRGGQVVHQTSRRGHKNVDAAEQRSAHHGCAHQLPLLLAQRHSRGRQADLQRN